MLLDKSVGRDSTSGLFVPKGLDFGVELVKRPIMPTLIGTLYR